MRLFLIFIVTLCISPVFCQEQSPWDKFVGTLKEAVKAGEAVFNGIVDGIGSIVQPIKNSICERVSSLPAPLPEGTDPLLAALAGTIMRVQPWISTTFCT